MNACLRYHIWYLLILSNWCDWMSYIFISFPIVSPSTHQVTTIFLLSNLKLQYCYLSFLVQIVDSIISHGSFLNNSFIEHSVVGIRSRINSNVHLKVWCNHSTKYRRWQCILLSALPWIPDLSVVWHVSN